jgi:hypothetical protein
MAGRGHARKPAKAITGLAPGDLRSLTDFKKFQMRSDVAVQFDEMSKAMLDAFANRPNPKDTIGVASTYRDAKRDAQAWQKVFKKYFGRTEEKRKETGDELGKEALKIMFHTINGKKAPPGFSGHTHGIAADLTTTEGGHVWEVNADYVHQVGWQKTWLYGWLVDKAGDYNFYQLKTETWHWEYHDKEPRPTDQCRASDVSIRHRVVKKPE